MTPKPPKLPRAPKTPPPVRFTCMEVKLVPAEKVVANDYNPNSVAPEEMELLRRSIQDNGLAYAVAACYDPEADLYVVVDGFHRYSLLKGYFRCPEIPVVEVDRPIQGRMAATVQFNRARGKHQVDLMSALVESLLRLGWDDTEIAKHLGMPAEEVLRLKQLTGLAELFANQPFSRAWVRGPEEAQLYREGEPS